MEEKKNLELKVNKKEEQQNRKLTYEELENAARQISEQARAFSIENRQLKEKLQAVSMGNAYAELNFKFEVIKNAHAFSSEFVDKIVQEIEEIMTPVEDTEETPETDKE